MLSVIIPTYNEKDNLAVLVKEIFSVLKKENILAELIIIDDNSSDGTGELADGLRQGFPQIQVIHRAGKLGLASAVLTGFKKAKFGIYGVLDADLSHPPEVIPQMFKLIMNKEADFVIGSRFIERGGIKNWPLRRKLISSFARSLTRPITSVRDSTSGFFMLKKEVIERVSLSPYGFKICLEIIAKGNYENIREIPITFVDRNKGESKLGSKVIFEYLKQLLKLYTLRIKKEKRK